MKRLPSCATRTGVCATAVALAAACLPERDLASYAAGLPLQVNAPAITVEREDAGAGDDSPAVPRGPDAAADPVEAGGATPLPAPSRLACRQECECELRDGRDFMLCGAPVTYALAADRCERAGGALVSIEDAGENEWLSQRMAALASDDYWTSGTDAEDEGVWRWADGRVFHDEAADAASDLGFAAWDEGQPNDFEGEDCLRVVDGLWRDLDCGEEIAYACEQ